MEGQQRSVSPVPMANSIQPSRTRKPRVYHGSGQVIRLRCDVCGVVIGEARARESVVTATHLRGWCNEHLPGVRSAVVAAHQ